MSENLQGYEALQRRIHAISGPVLGKPLMGLLAVAAVREAKILAPVRTRNLERSIHYADVTATSARVIASAKYARFVEAGTGPHVIVPRNRKALAFPSQKVTTERFGAGAILKFRKTGSLTTGSTRKYGNASFAVVRRVRHPGTKAHPFLQPGSEKAIRSAGLLDRIVAAWNEAA